MKLIAALVCLAFFLMGCQIPAVIATLEVWTATSTQTPTSTPTQTPSRTPTLTASPSSTPSPTQLPTETLTPSQTATATPTATPQPSATPTWAYAEGRVVAPILLYHHIAENGAGNRYYVSPENFQTQMQALRTWGYTSVTPSYLVNILRSGGGLPPRPVVITFDDGNLDVYTTAFPIMQQLGFVGGFYIVANRLEVDGYVNATQLSEMVAAGWEVGSHSMSHADLTINHSILREEILQSRLLLEDEIGVPVRTFAYPFGVIDAYVLEKTEEYGYVGGMGLGTFNEHFLGGHFYLSRREVHYEFDLTAFAALLPWTEP